VVLPRITRGRFAGSEQIIPAPLHGRHLDSITRQIWLPGAALGHRPAPWFSGTSSDRLTGVVGEKCARDKKLPASIEDLARLEAVGNLGLKRLYRPIPAFNVTVR
jgi:hypothetical protein